MYLKLQEITAQSVPSLENTMRTQVQEHTNAAVVIMHFSAPVISMILAQAGQVFTI